MSYSSRKQHNERNQQILKALLKDEPNKFCADCKNSKNPRWASWNLGIFICIRCSGIHRSMGTHISRVKSVDLDSWTDEQVKSMVKWGNAKANGFWESSLPGGYVPNESKIENFIRTKYDLKKWTNGSTPDPATAHAKPTPTPRVVSGGTKTRDSPLPIPGSRTTSGSKPSGSLLDLDFGVSNPTPSATPQAPSTTAASQQHKPKPEATSQSSSNLGALSFLDDSASSTGSSSQHQRPVNNADLKKSILSLYSSPSPSPAASTNSLPLMNGGGRASTPLYYPNTTAKPQSTTNLTSGLAGLKLGNGSGSNSTSIIGAGSQTSNGWSGLDNTTASSGISNPWSSSNTATTTTTANKKKYDDDVFKNVWN